MNNNVYIRSNRSIMTISITRLMMILPLVIYGIYKNGIFLYRNHLVNALAIFKPIVIIFGGALIALMINCCYEYFFMKHTDNKFWDSVFSSFHIEYAILLGCIMSINVNVFLYFTILTIVLVISKFLGDKVNTICFCFLLIYAISSILNGFEFMNVYETSKTFSYEFIDYLIGRAPGGIASTHIILLFLAMFGLALTNNNKTAISLVSIITYSVFMLIYAIITHNDFASIIFSNNYLFIVILIATDSVTSCYTNRGMIISGILIAFLSFGMYFINPIIAPIVAVLIVSIIVHFLDEKIYEVSDNKIIRHLFNN